LLPEHLHAEDGFLSVSEQLVLACKQFLASAFQWKHPSHNTVRLPTGTHSGRREIIHTLQSRFGKSVRPFLNREGVLLEISNRRTLSALHTAAVTASKAKLVNKLLGRVSTDFNLIEDTLPRRTRTTLSQVRSTYCNKLESYQARVGQPPSDLYPACRSTPHTSEYLFNCTSFPKNLNKLDLWSHPQETADFL
jgi:hypothetical protein